MKPHAFQLIIIVLLGLILFLDIRENQQSTNTATPTIIEPAITQSSFDARELGASFKCTRLAPSYKGQLCASNSAYQQHWLYITGTGRDPIALNIALDAEYISDILPSPSGQWVAITSASEGHPSLAIYASSDLLNPNRIATDTAIRYVDLNRKMLSIVGWQKDKLILENNDTGQQQTLKDPEFKSTLMP